MSEPPRPIPYAPAPRRRRKLKSALDAFAIAATSAAWPTIVAWEAGGGFRTGAQSRTDYLVVLGLLSGMAACGIGMAAGGCFSVAYGIISRLAGPVSYRRWRTAAACGAVAGVAITSAGYKLGIRPALIGAGGPMPWRWTAVQIVVSVVLPMTAAYACFAHLPLRRRPIR